MLLIKTGVFTLHNAQWIYDDLDNGINLSQIEREIEYHKSLIAKYNLPDDYDFSVDEKEIIDESERDMFLETDGTDQIYIGFIQNSEGIYIEDPEAEYSCICDETNGFVTASKYVCYCNHGSPCIPHQGDLETDGNELCFTLPADVWGDFKPEFMKIIEISPSAKVENLTRIKLNNSFF